MPKGVAPDSPIPSPPNHFKLVHAGFKPSKKHCKTNFGGLKRETHSCFMCLQTRNLVKCHKCGTHFCKPDPTNANDPISFYNHNDDERPCGFVTADREYACPQCYGACCACATVKPLSELQDRGAIAISSKACLENTKECEGGCNLSIPCFTCNKGFHREWGLLETAHFEDPQCVGCWLDE